jgi:hypothetical protein
LKDFAAKREACIRKRHQDDGESLSAKSLDKAVEVQSEYAKSAYEGYVTLATKLGQIYADLAKETFKPYESLSRK